MAARTPIFVVAGVGNGSGTGAGAARVFAKTGYNVALIARNPEHLAKATQELKDGGANVASFLVQDYSYGALHAAFANIRAQWPDAEIRVALYNAAFGAWKSFLDVTEEEVRKSVDDNIVGAFAFSREAILAFKDLPVDKFGRRGALLFTGATASIRGNVTTSAFATGKHAKRALAQSLAKEFGKQNIHVVHAVIDGLILTDRVRERRGDKEWEANEDVRLDPEAIGQTYLHLAEQHRSTWTWELDLRPAHEKW